MDLLVNHISFFNNYPLKQIKPNKSVLKAIYRDFKCASAKSSFFLEGLDEEMNKINLIKEIPGLHLLNSIYVPEVIKKSIKEESTFYVEYIFKLFQRKIYVYFISQGVDHPNLKDYREYMKLIYTWLYVASLYANKTCSSDYLKIYIFMTDFKRNLPDKSIDTIGPFHVNGGLSDMCRKQSEMLIFRKEEWFKVFVHETFHNLGLDFSDMSIKKEVD